MTDVRLTVSGRRSVVEGIGFAFLTMLHTFFENVVVFPEFLDCFLAVYKIQACGYLLVHTVLPFFSYYSIILFSSSFTKSHLRCFPE